MWVLAVIIYGAIAYMVVMFVFLLAFVSYDATGSFVISAVCGGVIVMFLIALWKTISGASRNE